MNKMGIIADDLTGASDSGVQLARQGYTSVVLFESKISGTPLPPADVIVADTDSRALPIREAYEQVHSAAAAFNELGIGLLFKKLDSTLRGNVGVEIDAVMDAAPYDFAIVAPAFPRLGRTTLNGVHYLQGKPIHETEIAKDPKCPVRESNLVALLASQSKRKAGLVARSLLLQGQEAVAEQLQRYKEQSVPLIVFDAVEDDDLRKMVDYISAMSYKVLWAGSAGLAEFMPRLLPEPEGKREVYRVPATGKPVMLVSGSLSAVTKEQVEAFALAPNVESVSLDPLRVLQPERRDGEMARCKAEIVRALAMRKDICFYAGPLAERDTIGLDSSLAAHLIAEALGLVGAEVIEQNELQGVILTGGDTARSVCRHLGVSGIKLLEEVETGIPLSRMIGPKQILTVTKAGAFGTDLSLVHALQALKGEAQLES
jgi:uncharacterized protein YgbK (DUF1537 family)